MKIGNRVFIANIEFSSELWWIQEDSFKYSRLIGIDIVTGGNNLAWSIQLIIFPMMIGFSVSKRMS
jgi:calcineurin-like phosphoesterase